MTPVPRDRQTTRLETFVDAAFAFALTMLVISVDSIPGSMDELVQAFGRIPAFAASFAIIVMLWHGHYRWSRRYGVEDTGSVVLSLLLVFLVLVYLYPLRLMMAGALNSVSGGWLPAEIEITRLEDLRLLVIVYGVAFALLSGVLLALYARVQRLAVDPPLSAEDLAIAGVEVQRWGVLAGAGAASATLAVFAPLRHLGWAVWLYASLAVIMPLLGRRWHRQVRRAVAAESEGTTPCVRPAQPPA
ncbi:MAG: hypothetical protein RL261_2270 [Pseudomonadota bacterium]